MKHVLATTASLIVMLASAPSVGAQPACPARPADATVAKGLASTWWRFGISFFEAKSYAKAIYAWQCANRLAPHPLAHYNIARAADRAGKKALAIRSYQSFLKIRPQSPKRPEVESRIRALTAAPTSTRRRPAAVPDVTPGTGSTPKPRPGRTLRTTGWTALAVGVALAVGSGVFGGLAAAEREAVETATPGTLWDPTIAVHDQRFRSFRLGAWISSGVAVAAIVSGATLLFLGRRRPQRERARVAPTVLRGGAGVSVSLTF